MLRAGVGVEMLAESFLRGRGSLEGVLGVGSWQELGSEPKMLLSASMGRLWVLSQQS